MKNKIALTQYKLAWNKAYKAKWNKSHPYKRTREQLDRVNAHRRHLYHTDPEYRKRRDRSSMIGYCKRQIRKYEEWIVRLANEK